MSAHNEKLIEALARSGGGVLIVGAGFNFGSTDAAKHKLPSSDELASEVLQTIGKAPQAQTSLLDVMDFVESRAAGQKQVVDELFVRRLVDCVPGPAQAIIANIPWRTVYSTNYDDVLERARDAFYPLYPEDFSNQAPP